ncbi:MAG: DUF805 domain-containing protein [Fusobacterium sp.]|nr:DUF805 domain-containing protein [Fusobacterium sp.]
MGWIESYKVCMFQKIFKISGRASREEFWKFWLVSIIVSTIIGKFSGTLETIYSYIFLVADFSASCRRLHDVNESAKSIFYFYGMSFAFTIIDYALIKLFYNDLDNFLEVRFDLLAIQLVIGLGFFIYIILLLAKKGDIEANKYGEPTTKKQ